MTRFGYATSTDTSGWSGRARVLIEIYRCTCNSCNRQASNTASQPYLSEHRIYETLTFNLVMVLSVEVYTYHLSTTLINCYPYLTYSEWNFKTVTFPRFTILKRLCISTAHGRQYIVSAVSYSVNQLCLDVTSTTSQLYPSRQDKLATAN
jgi:hypothetical protein